MSIKVGVISDTHGLLREEVLDVLRTCDHIIHAGDFDNEQIWEELGELAPLTAVRGNNDWSSWASRLPRQRTFTIGGVGFAMAHKREDIPWSLNDARVIVFGHTHEYFEDWIEGRLWLNPGSCGWPRYRKSLSMATLTIDGKDLWVQQINLHP